MSNARVRRAIEEEMADWVALFPIQVAYENYPFTPTVGTRFCRAFMLPASTEQQFLSGYHRGYIGVYQISIFTPINKGPAAAEEVLTSLEGYFLPGSRYPVVESAVTVLTVEVTSPVSAGPAQQDEGWYLLPTWFTYRADGIYTPPSPPGDPDPPPI